MVEKRAIELIPKELEEERRQSQMMRSARLVGFGILGAAVLATVVALALVGGQRAVSAGIQRQITEKETKISELSAIEEKLILFASKNSALTGVFKKRSYFSILLDKLTECTPSGITVTGLTTSNVDITVTVSGKVITYTELAAFLRNLIDPDKGGTLFTEAGLTSVSFDPTEGSAQFIAELTLATNGLKKGWEALLTEAASGE